MIDITPFESKVWIFDGTVYQKEEELRKEMTKSLVKDFQQKLWELTIFSATIPQHEYKSRYCECEEDFRYIQKHLNELANLRITKNEREGKNV